MLLEQNTAFVGNRENGTAIYKILSCITFDENTYESCRKLCKFNPYLNKNRG